MIKQTSLNWLSIQIANKFAKELTVVHVQQLSELLEIAEKKRKEEIIQAYRDGRTDQQSGIDKWYNRSSSGYYQETYGGENE